MQPHDSALTKSKASYRPDIDGLRAIAILAVVIYHANPGALRGGFVGVDIFFVISGFLITGILLEEINGRHFSLANFYARRVRRLFPALIVVLLSAWLVGWFILPVDEFQNLGKHIIAGAAFVPNIVYWNEIGYFDVESTRKILLHLWSLGVEEQFYFVWPLLLLLLIKMRAAVAAIALLAIASFSTNIYLSLNAPGAAFYLPIPRFWELLIGSLLAVAAMPQSAGRIPKELLAIATPAATPRTNEIKAWAGLTLIVISLLLINRWRIFPGYWALLPAFGSALLVAAGPSTRINQALLSNRLMVGVGLISYPLYLWHWPLLAFAENIRGYDLSKLERMLVVLPAFPLAWLTNRFIERPIRFGTVSRGIELRSIALVSCIAAMAGLGLWNYWKHGMPSRFPEEIRTVLAARHDPVASYRYGTCFLDASRHDVTSYGQQCMDTDNAGRKPLLVIWGDSHGAHLYPGLRELQKTLSFRLGQFTGCEPLVSAQTSAACRQSVSAIQHLIQKNSPEIVVLAMRWSQHSDVEQALRDQFELLRSYNVKEIVVVGPAPQWRPNAKGAIAHNYLWNGKIEGRTRFGLTQFEALAKQDELLSNVATAANVRYISALKALCNSEGCLTVLDQEPVAIDSDHYSDAASAYIMKKAAAEFAAALSKVKR